METNPLVDRLTKRDEFNTPYIPIPTKLLNNPNCETILSKKAINKLCEYEDKIEHGELVEAKLGHWNKIETHGGTLAICSECSYPLSWWHKNKYCPSCGTTMIRSPKNENN